jgi:hypothetical protein
LFSPFGLTIESIKRVGGASKRVWDANEEGVVREVLKGVSKPQALNM